MRDLTKKQENNPSIPDQPPDRPFSEKPQPDIIIEQPNIVSNKQIVSESISQVPNPLLHATNQLDSPQIPVHDPIFNTSPIKQNSEGNKSSSEQSIYKNSGDQQLSWTPSFSSQTYITSALDEDLCINLFSILEKPILNLHKLDQLSTNARIFLQDIEDPRRNYGTYDTNFSFGTFTYSNDDNLLQYPNEEITQVNVKKEINSLPKSRFTISVKQQFIDSLPQTNILSDTYTDRHGSLRTTINYSSDELSKLNQGSAAKSYKHLFILTIEPNFNQISRTLKDFKWLHNALELQFPANYVPPAPPQQAIGADTVKAGQKLEHFLQRFINKILESDELRNSLLFETFMTIDNLSKDRKQAIISNIKVDEPSQYTSSRGVLLVDTKEPNYIIKDIKSTFVNQINLKRTLKRQLNEVKHCLSNINGTLTEMSDDLYQLSRAQNLMEATDDFRRASGDTYKTIAQGFVQCKDVQQTRIEMIKKLTTLFKFGYMEYAPLRALYKKMKKMKKEMKKWKHRFTIKPRGQAEMQNFPKYQQIYGIHNAKLYEEFITTTQSARVREAGELCEFFKTSLQLEDMLIENWKNFQ